nr:class I tRNA ligase family protein [Micromonospora sp. DSM 115978]
AQLRDRGSVYQVDTDLYFSVASCPRFGSVSHLGHAAMVTRSADNGGDPERAGKKDPLDPLVWRGHRPGEPSWESPFGPGRPGWHVECAAIARTYLGDTVDVQGGGRDLVFPHHECSAAHSEVASGQVPFARAYVHSGLVALDGEKMSKSLGNLEFVSRLRAQGADPAAIRLALLDHHYRADWEWDGAMLDAATVRLDRWRAAAATAQAASSRSGTATDAGPLGAQGLLRLLDELRRAL